MIYIMNERYPYNQPDESYYQVVLESYTELGFDPKILEAYLAKNLEDEAKPSEESAEKTLTPTIRKQIMAIRAGGETNMLDTRRVQQIADREGYYELVVYLEEHGKEYWNFIMTGEES